MNRRQLGPTNRPAELASWVMMGNTQKGKSTLMIEGTSDSNALLAFANGETCRLIVAEGKENVLAAMAILRSAEYVGAFAVVDADFDRLEDRDCGSNDVAYTDSHDLETMMLSTEAFRKVLLRNGYLKHGRVEVNVEQLDVLAVELRSRLLHIGSTLGYIRWASVRHKLRIDFDSVDLARAVDASTLTVREDRLEEEVLRASTASAGSWQQIKSLSQALHSEQHDRWQICNGHDLTALLALHLSRTTGAHVTRKSIQADLASAYSSGDFQKTQVYAAISAWEQRNAPRRILR